MDSIQSIPDPEKPYIIQVAGLRYQCQRPSCMHVWGPKSGEIKPGDELPATCPRCNSARWMRAPVRVKKSDPDKPTDKPTGISNAITIGA